MIDNVGGSITKQTAVYAAFGLVIVPEEGE
jgi:hypothetical protein